MLYENGHFAVTETWMINIKKIARSMIISDLRTNFIYQFDP